MRRSPSGASTDADRAWGVICTALRSFPVIPALRGVADWRAASARPAAAVLVFKGTVFEVREVVAASGSRPVLVHVDLLEGVGKDEAGLRLLHEMGVCGIASTRAHLIRHARRRGLVALQRLFALDSDALSTGIASARDSRPHAVEVLPGPVVPSLMPRLSGELDLPIIGAGLISSARQVRCVLAAGAMGVSTSAQHLWGVPAAGFADPPRLDRPGSTL